MEIQNPRTYSDLQIPPGEVLAEEIAARGMTEKELTARLGMPEKSINDIIEGRKAITPETAIGLGKILGISAQLWNTLEADYRMVLARTDSKKE